MISHRIYTSTGPVIIWMWYYEWILSYRVNKERWPQRWYSWQWKIHEAKVSQPLCGGKIQWQIHLMSDPSGPILYHTYDLRPTYLLVPVSWLQHSCTAGSVDVCLVANPHQSVLELDELFAPLASTQQTASHAKKQHHNIKTDSLIFGELIYQQSQWL